MQAVSSIALVVEQHSQQAKPIITDQLLPSHHHQGVQLTPHTHNECVDSSTQASPAAAAQDNKDADRDSNTGDDPSGKRARWQRLKAGTAAFVLSNFMLISFSLAAALAMAWPLPGKVVASWSVGDVRVVQAINNFLVFLISGLTLKSDDFRCGWQ